MALGPGKPECGGEHQSLCMGIPVAQELIHNLWNPVQHENAVLVQNIFQNFKPVTAEHWLSDLVKVTKPSTGPCSTAQASHPGSRPWMLKGF